jgi:hypothetical protein
MKEFINEIRGIISDQLKWIKMNRLPEAGKWNRWRTLRVHFSRVEYDEDRP